MTTITEQELLRLKKQVENAKQDVAEQTGQRTALLKQLQTEFNCQTLDDAAREIKKLETELAHINAQLEKGANELREKFDL